MPGIVLNKLSKTYQGGVVAVDDVSLTIGGGEFLVLVGPSGCGKSTLLRMVAGLEEVTEGTISIDGRDVTDLPPRERDVAMVFQNYALYPHMSVYKNMAFGLKLRGMPKAQIKQRVDEAAKILDITHLLERKPKALSGGQRQRVDAAGQLLGDCRFVNRDRLRCQNCPRERYIFRRRNTESLRDPRIARCFSGDRELVDYSIALFLEATNTSRQWVNLMQVVQ